MRGLQKLQNHQVLNESDTKVTELSSNGNTRENTLGTQKSVPYRTKLRKYRQTTTKRQQNIQKHTQNNQRNTNAPLTFAAAPSREAPSPSPSPSPATAEAANTLPLLPSLIPNQAPPPSGVQGSRGGDPSLAAASTSASAPVAEEEAAPAAASARGVVASLGIMMESAPLHRMRTRLGARYFFPPSNTRTGDCAYCGRRSANGCDIRVVRG